jgi:exodeoxyribonuclease VII small subunit
MNADRHDEDVPEHDASVGELSFTAASRELDGIVEFFEKSEVDVDQLVARLERATAIVDELDRRIRRTRAQVEELVPKLEAVGRSSASGPSPADDDDDAGEEPGADRSAVIGTEEGESEGEQLPF